MSRAYGGDVGFLASPPLSMERSAPIEVTETSANEGAWIVPAVKDVALALALSDFSARWRESGVLRSENISSSSVSICQRDQLRRFDIRTPAKFAIIRLRSELLAQAQREMRQRRTELQSHDVLDDLTLSRLMKVLLREKREGFQNGKLFLDSVAIALSSYLLRRYSGEPSVTDTFGGGLAPSALRRSIEFMDAHLEGELRLSDLAREAGISESHFIRSFRESTGKTPHQFLLDRRVERAQSLMRDQHISLTEVALASGFADQHHFARVFRRVSGMTPSDYRRSLR